MTAKEVEKHLKKYYDKQALYIVPNIYALDGRYGETDLFVVKSSNRFCYDIEIKVTKSDFKADFKKKFKHTILQEGCLISKYNTYRTNMEGKRVRYKQGAPIPMQRPNRFYFAVPKDLILKSEVPKYAGLFYIHKNGRVEKIKEAPLLHKEILDIEKLLCRKFYFYWLNELNKNK